MQERTTKPMSGWGPLLVNILMFIASIVIFVMGVARVNGAHGAPVAGTAMIIGSGLLLALWFIMIFGFMAIPPNMARVLLLFGDYRGSVRESGFYWTNPFYSKKKISLRVRNFETGSTTTPEQKDATTGKIIVQKTRSSGKPSKVNDRDGNPIEISAVVVWQVVDTAEAMLEVDDYEDYVAVQSEAALRNMASRYPYDSHDQEISLRGNTQEVSAQLRQDIQERLDKAGVKVLEARISHLAYAPEIAAAMLQRQQAQAIVAARTKIVEGAVGMVEMALDHLLKDQIVELDEERKAAMVSNLLVVLCADRHPQPVINTGSIYQ